MRSAERQLAAATARIGVAKAALFPALSISGNLDTDAATLGNLGSLLTGGLFAGLTQTIFDAGKRRSQVRSARAAADLAFANYRQTVLSGLEDVENAVQSLKAAKARQAELAIALDAASNAAIYSRSQYRSGLIDFLSSCRASRRFSRPATSWLRRRRTRRSRWSSSISRSAAAGSRIEPIHRGPRHDGQRRSTSSSASRRARAGGVGANGSSSACPSDRAAAAGPLLPAGTPGPLCDRAGRAARSDVTITATGNLAPTVQVNVGSEESGLVDKVYVHNNDHVVKGQPLAQLDLSRLQDALVQSQASLQAALATVAQNRATVAQTRANLARQEQVFKLSGGKVPSQTEIDTARADYARAVANVAQAEAQVAQARADVSSNRTNLAKGTIYAPVTGVVLSRQVEPGQTVAASFNVATLFTIAQDLSRMRLQVKVDEADVGELHPGAAATFTVDAYPNRTFPATVTRVDLGANATPMVNSAGTTPTTPTKWSPIRPSSRSRTPDQLLKPGMTATATIVTDSVSNVLLVPNAALRFTPPAGPAKKSIFNGAARAPKNANVSRGARQQLWVVGPAGKPKAIPVTIGHSNGSLTEVRGPGLHPGLQVITGQLAGTGQIGWRSR